MSGENTEVPHDLHEGTTTDATAPGDAAPGATSVEAFDVPAPETMAAPDAEAAIDEFEVPPPPPFDASPPASSPAPVIPPPPPESDAPDASDAPAAPALRKRSTWAPNDTWTSASAHKQEQVPPTAAQKAEARAAASRAATARDEATRNYVSPAAGGTEGNSYRGWTVAIYGGLAVLFFGSIGFMAFLGLPG